MPRALFSHETPHVLWFLALKIGQRSVYMPILTPKWRQNGTWLANWPELIFSTCAPGATRKNLTFFARIEFGRFGLLQNWGKCTLEIMGQAGVFPALYRCWKAAGARHKDQEMAQNGRFSQAEGWWTPFNRPEMHSYPYRAEPETGRYRAQNSIPRALFPHKSPHY